MNNQNDGQSRVMAAFRLRSERGIPNIINSLLGESLDVKLFHSGVGPDSGNLHALTFTVQAKLDESTERIWQMLEPRIEQWIQAQGARTSGRSPYHNEESMEVEFDYSAQAVRGIFTLIIADLRNGRKLIHGRICENAINAEKPN